MYKAGVPAEWLAERGVSVDPSTIWDWVQAYAPKLNEVARAHRSRAGCYVDAVRLECPGAKHLTRRSLNNRLGLAG